MKTLADVREELFHKSFVLIFLGLLMITLVVQILSSSTFLMYLPRPRAIIIALILAFSLLSRLAMVFCSWFTRRYEIDVPTVRLWMVPLTSLFSVYGLMMILLAGAHSWIGRGFWSDVSHLNAKMTTVMFTTTFISFKCYVFIGFVGAIWEYLRFFLAAFEAGESLQEKAFIGEPIRQRASRFNRRCFLAMLIISCILGGTLVFFKPETILYYRGEIQVRSGIYPEVALETFQHLVRKFPDYRYRDTVEFRAAWVLDRRLKKYDEAISAYREFLGRYGDENVWAPDVMANLIVIFLDQQKDTASALHWIQIFEKKFPHSVTLPLIALYKVRALLQADRRNEAILAAESAGERFRGHTLILYDTEDDFLTTLPFAAALGTLNL